MRLKYWINRVLRLKQIFPQAEQLDVILQKSRDLSDTAAEADISHFDCEFRITDGMQMSTDSVVTPQ